MKRALLLGGALVAGAHGVAQADGRAGARSVSVAVGYDFSQNDGDVGSDDAIDVVTLGAKLTLGDWSFGASTGYVDLSDDPGSAFVGPRGQEFEIVSGQASSGFTDLVFSAGYALADETKTRPGVYVSSAVKLPTADEDAGLSSGAVDVSGSVELYKTVSIVTAYLYAGGRIRGESDDEAAARRFQFRLDPDMTEEDAAPAQRDAFEGGLGVQIPLGSRWSGSLGYDYRGAPFEGGDDAHELTALLSVSPTTSTTLTGYVYQGLGNEDAPAGGGVYISQKILQW